MWQPSKKWLGDKAKGKHSVVRFDVYCAQCDKLIEEDVNDITHGIKTQHPYDVFCSRSCIKAYQELHKRYVLKYGYYPAVS